MVNINMEQVRAVGKSEARDRTILLVHGMWSRPHIWTNFRAYFEDRGYRVVTPALRHHDIEPGDEPHPTLGTTSILDYVADIEANIKDLGCKPFVIGHSMGGLIAQMLAARGLVRGAALLSTAPCAPILSFNTDIVRIFFRELTATPFWRCPQLPSYKAMRWSVLNGFNERDARNLYASLIPESGRSFFEIAFWYLDRRRATLVDARKVQCPVLVMTGLDDRLTPAPLAIRNAAYFGNKARLELVPGHSHWLPSETGWEEIAERTARFFEIEAPRMWIEVGVSEPSDGLLQPFPV
ncbi:MAG: alpha/beta hydrolase [Parvibaculum sp.]|uniref:alpha/beta hydrolase n=1 Tax=Parvibaculum sp. TaxID=2024848 RepID=UPI002842C370|nr:alpha/beta hydrolase [Parvibaculum sp.]MDR3498272.1 alpha/beta hydrolase [Parvibaculum sp.]